MRAGDPGWETTRDGRGGTWRVGAAVEGGWVKKPGSWGTGFSCFRYAIPELCDFDGFAIYLDADQLVLGDIAELWSLRPAKGRAFRCISWNRTDVSVIDCSALKGKSWWPSIAKMKPTGAVGGQYVRFLHNKKMIDATLPEVWNDCDGKIYGKAPGTVKLEHYTNVMIGQPYRPYPNVDYPKTYPYCETNRDIGLLWWDTYEQALIEAHGPEEGARILAEAKA